MTSLAGLHAGVSSGSSYLDWRPIPFSSPVVLQQRCILILSFLVLVTLYFVPPLSDFRVVVVSLGVMTGDQCSYS